MEIREFREGDVLVLAPEGSVSGSEETSAIETKLGALYKAGFRLLVLDCAGVAALTSGAIRILLMTSRKLDRTEGRLVLCGMNAKVAKAFSISGFDKDFTVVATREQALQRVLEPVGPRPARVTKAVVPRHEPAAEVSGLPTSADSSAVVPEMVPAACAPEPVVQVSAPAPVVAPPPGPDLHALAAALLDALGADVSRFQVAGRTGHSGLELDALASGLMTALRVGVS